MRTGFRILATLAAIASATGAHAFNRMMRADCRTTVEKIGDLVIRENAQTQSDFDAVIAAIRVTPQGWCEIPARAQGLDFMEMDSLQWRAEGVTRWTRDGIPPLALEVRMTGLDPDEMQGGDTTTRRPPVTVEALLRQDPGAGLIVIEHAAMFNDAGDIMTVSGVFERVFLSSPSMMQISMGSATFKAGLMTMTLDGTHENPFAFSIDVDVRGNPTAQQEAMFESITSLPDGLIDDASRAELTAYAGDLPKPIGTLEVSVASENGLGLAQVGMALYSGFVSIMDEGAISEEMEILFSGLTMTADWSPKAQVAD